MSSRSRRKRAAALGARARKAPAKGVENKPLMRAMQELRHSNAAGAHTPKPRKGTRGAIKRAAIDEQRKDAHD